MNVCITPGSLTCAIYTDDCPELAGRCEPWFAGVDTAYWSPASPPGKRERILFYDKQTNGATDAVAPYVALVAGKGYAVSTLEYGSYTREQFRQLLRESRLMIGFSAAESQGIAWAEAWSTDVPTLLWYTGEHVFDHPRAQGRILRTSTAPHLTDATGRFFSNLDEFTTLFAQWETGGLRWTPRAWVLENMSDEVCARRLCELAGLRIPA